MKTLRYSAILIAAMLIAGCATTFHPWNLSMVKEGMERDQVLKILGNPDSTEDKDGAEYLHYVYREDYHPSPESVPFYGQDNDRAFRDLNTQEAFKKYEYVVILADGKVINYKEL